MQQIYRRAPMPKCDFNKAPELKNCKKKMGKIIVLVLILKKTQKLGINVHEAFALIVTKADTALAWASINVNKCVTFCCLQIVLL